ncbi:MAG: hypothetical protein KatS3mg026_0795 [Bacteroidia bacterium]|nr:MAG: hypothetical protein KatS3mg026_0795 [Bacteroidia bacterium]
MGPLSPSHLTGYWGFHLAKYEISQGQFADFLSHASYAWSAPVSDRNRTQPGGLGFYSDRPDRAQGYISVVDFLTYCDWAALRPATSFEYIKAVRGSFAPPSNPDSYLEYAWGIDTGATCGTTFSGAENGTEEFTAPSGSNCTCDGVTYIGGDGGQGPARVGIHAKTTTTDRRSSGAGYFGNLDLCGNVWELLHSRAACVECDLQQSLGKTHAGRRRPWSWWA